VHLVRAANGAGPFREFLDAYSRHDAGTEHALVLLFKGFRAEADADPYLALAKEHPARAIFVDDTGFDLTAYLSATRTLQGSLRCCYLNSYTRPLKDGWLSALVAPLSRPEVGLTGICGSYESAYTSAPFWGKARRRAAFAPFPNPHLRSNGFVINRELLLDLDCPPPGSKWAALAIEGGKRSLTRQVWERGLEVLVVGRDGVAYPPERWRESATFRSGGQRNLLLADNRTRQYETADPALRERLAQMAWGDAQVSLPDWAAPARRATQL
jgi:hypothetical protein